MEPVVQAPLQPSVNLSAVGPNETVRMMVEYETERVEKSAVLLTLDSHRDSSDPQ